MLDPRAYFEWRERWHGDIVPLIVFDDGRRVVEGFEPRSLEKVLKELGYR
jgi:hypothetical protein